MAITDQSTTFSIESAGIDPNGRTPKVAVLSDGRFVVVWAEKLASPADGFNDTDGGIFARIYNADGTADGDTIQINGWMPGLQDAPEVAATSDGGFSVSFNSTLIWGDTPTDVDTFLYTFDAAGTLKPYFDSHGDLQQFRDIDPDNPGEDTGNFMTDLGHGYLAMVAERGSHFGANSDSQVTLLGPGGTVLGSTSDLSAFDEIHSVARLEGGNMLIAGTSNNDVVLRLSGPDLGGPPEGIPGLVGPVIFYSMTGMMEANDVRVTALDPGSDAPGGAGGGFVLTALQPNGAISSLLVMQSYTAWGALVSTNSINTTISLNGAHPVYDVLALRDGTYVVAWTTKATNGLDIMVNHFDSNGAQLGTAQVIQANAIDQDQTNPSLSQLDDGRVILVYSDFGSHVIGGTVDPIHGVILDLSSTSGGYPATVGDDKLFGTGGHDGIDGLAGDDQINGRAGNDVLFGGDGNDSLVGATGNDGLVGGNGNDLMDGSEGNDGLAGGVGSDTLKGGDGRDALSGGIQSDRLFGGIDRDRLDGGLGGDTLTGNTGADTFVFRHGGGADVVTDFAADDLLRLDHALWIESGDLTAAQVLSRFAAVVGTDTVLTFVDGESIVLQGYTALAASDLQII